MADYPDLHYNQTKLANYNDEINNSPNGVDVWRLILALSLPILIILIIVLIFIIYRHRFNKTVRKIKNPLVITFSITKFDSMPQRPEIEAVLTDLNGIGIDIQNINTFFMQEMNYHVVPKYNENVEVYWTKQKLMHYFQQYAEHFTANIDTYDALILIISGHSSREYICTSDYKKISKNQIYGIFSVEYSETGRIPRLFIFNCYDNDNEPTSNSRTETLNTPNFEVISNETAPLELPSNYNLVKNASVMDRFDDNLAVIHAVKEQSHLIPQFMNELRKNNRRGANCCDCRNKLFLHDITEEIECKSMYNDGTENIVFNKSEFKMETSDLIVDDLMIETFETKKPTQRSLDTMDKIWNEMVEMDDGMKHKVQEEDSYENEIEVIIDTKENEHIDTKENEHIDTELKEDMDNDHHHTIKTTDLLNHMEDALIEEEMMTKDSISLGNYVIRHNLDKGSATTSQMSSLIIMFDPELSENEEIP